MKAGSETPGVRIEQDNRTCQSLRERYETCYAEELRFSIRHQCGFIQIESYGRDRILERMLSMLPEEFQDIYDDTIPEAKEMCKKMGDKVDAFLGKSPLARMAVPI